MINQEYNCEECGCDIPNYYMKVRRIEICQLIIDELYKIQPIPKTEINRLKTERDKLLEEILSMLEEKEYMVRRELLRDRAIPIDWRTLERLDGIEYAEAIDEEDYLKGRNICGNLISRRGSKWVNFAVLVLIITFFKKCC